MPRAVCLTVQRDRTRMLDAWLRHHAYLVGFGNLVVHDENSTDPATLALLRRAQRAGADVRRRCGSGPAAQAHSLAAGGAALVLPLAVGEFLAVYTDDGVSCRRTDVQAVLDGPGGRDRVAAFAPALNAVAGRACEFALAPAGAARGERATRLTRLRFADVPDGAAARVVFPGFGHLMDALGIRDERLASPVPSPRGGPADAVWIRPAPDQAAIRFVAGSHDTAGGAGPPLPSALAATVPEKAWG